MKNKQLEELTPGWGWGYVIAQAQISFVQGRLLTLIESFGLKDSQEKAAKDLVSQELWRVYEGAISLGSKEHSRLRVEYANASIPQGVGTIENNAKSK
jgi:hypothetical protein